MAASERSDLPISDRDESKKKGGLKLVIFFLVPLLIVALILYVVWKLIVKLLVVLSYLGVFVVAVVAAILALPVLMASYLIIRFFQFIFGCGDAFDVATKLNLVILTGMTLDSAVLIILLAVFYGLIIHVPRLMHLGDVRVAILGSTLSKIIETNFILYGIYFFSYLLTLLIIRWAVFRIPTKYHTYKSGSLVVPHAVYEIINCLVLLYGAEYVVMKRHPHLRDYRVAGVYPVHQSIKVVLLVFVLYNLIRLSIYSIVWQLNNLSDYQHWFRKKFNMDRRLFRRRALMYWVDGMKSSVIFILSMLMLSHVWVFYFGIMLKKHGNENPTEDKDERIFKFGSLTCFLLVIFSALWLFRTCILLLFENRVIYRKFHGKISDAAAKLYFLGVIGRHKHDILHLHYHARKSSRLDDPTQPTADCFVKLLQCKCSKITENPLNYLLELLINCTESLLQGYKYYQSPDDHDDDEELNSERRPTYPRNVKKLSKKMKEKAQKELLWDPTEEPTLYELQQMAHYFLKAEMNLPPDKYVSDILEDLKSKTDDDRATIDRNKLKEKFQRFEGMFDEFIKKQLDLQLEISENLEIFYPKFEKWTKEACNSCVELANTISSVDELVVFLDRIMSGTLIVGFFALWLMLTGLAAFNTLALVGAPFIALAFMIQDSCSTFFKGLVFVYMVHPFGVGDLCVIDGNMLKVKRVDVIKTTFLIIDTMVEVIYPNSNLMSKNIVNHHTGFDWNFKVELYCEGAVDNAKILKLEENFEKYLRDKNYMTTSTINVEVSSTAEKNKIVVSFHYEPSFKNEHMTSQDCLGKKRKLYLEFFTHIDNLLKNPQVQQGKSNSQTEQIVEITE